MNTKELEKLYLTHEPEIKASLINQHIFDEDLFQDTCLELCIYAQHNDIRNFPGLFIERYKKLRKRQDQRQLDIAPCDNAQLAALDIPDDSQDVEILDQAIDSESRQFSAECICRDDDKERLQQLLDDFYKHPQPGERNHKRACRIIRLYLKGRSFREIANTMNLDVATVYKYFTRTIDHLKANTL